ncbi:hypothetical protein P4O66_019950, partial [Electrophorus voltai]
MLFFHICVLCGQLKCGSAVAVLGVDWFGEGSGHIWADVFDCHGNETHLSECPISSWSRTACSHKQDAGVICNEFKEIRLTEGCEGNLEVFYNRTWGNVCENRLDEEIATLICQELNYGTSGSENNDKPRVESSPDWLDDLKCRKHDSTLWHCPSSSWGKETCSSHVARITCTDHMPLRLRGAERSCSGRLEVYHNAVGGSICDDQWDIRDAEVVCRQLGCGKALRADGSAAFGAGEGVIWLNRVKCRGDEIHLWDCSYSLKKHTDCSHIEDAGVTCAGQRILLDSGVSSSMQKSFLPLLICKRCSEDIQSSTNCISSCSVHHPYSGPAGSVLSESQHSGYEDVDQAFVSEKSVTVDQAEYYDDVTATGDLISDIERQDIPENYDDVITAGPSPDIVAEEMTENYDDVITTGLNPNITAMATPEDCNDAGTNPNVTEMDTPENSDDVITAGQDVGGVNAFSWNHTQVKTLVADEAKARYLVKLHMVAVEMNSDTLKNGILYYTLTGKTAESVTESEQVKVHIHGSRRKGLLLESNIIALNGVIHITDKMMDTVPPTVISDSQVRKCCEGFYGVNCESCPGPEGQPCFGNGVCVDGINGTGACRCNPGFNGTACVSCQTGKYGIHCDQ